MTRTQPPRSGFTLVELLMVIAIIGLLASLTTVAVRYAIFKAKRTALQIEIDQLSQAINSYKEKNREFPPSFADNESNQNDTYDRLRQRFIDHLKFAFPRFNPTGEDPVAQYINLRDYVRSNYYVINPNSQGSTMALNLDNLVLNANNNSPAEAMVFWLAGMPMPVDTGQGGNSQMIASRKTFGFNADIFNPFKLEAPSSFPSGTTVTQRRDGWLAKRTKSLYEFDPSRLVDLDGDGWLEYAAKGEDGTGSEVHPYVYFDYKTYARPGAGAYSANGNATNAPGYKPYIHPVVGDRAVPYAQAIVPGQSINFAGGTSILWMRDTSFQIICGGLDGRYSNSADTKIFSLLPNNQSDSRYVGGGGLNAVNGSLLSFAVDEQDNQVNFSPMMIQEIQLK